MVMSKERKVLVSETRRWRMRAKELSSFLYAHVRLLKHAVCVLRPQGWDDPG